MGKIFTIFRIPELRMKIFFTLLLLAIYRLGYLIPLPFVDQVGFHDWAKRVHGSEFGQALGSLSMLGGTTLSQAWFSVFDGDRTEAFCSDVPLGESTFESNGSSLAAQVGPLRLQLAEDHGASAGELTSGAGRVRWDLRFDRLPGVLGRPMCLLPTRRLLDAPFPRNKLVTPLPVATFTGHVTWNDETWDIGRWIGMQGHNWGAAHSPEYAWGQCVFTDAIGQAPTAVMEGASGRIELGSRLSPLLSMLVVRRGEDEYRFDRVVDLWRPWIQSKVGTKS